MKSPPAFFHAPAPRPNATRRFFAFHHAGGAAANYRRLKDVLPSTYELVLAELPGRGRLAAIPGFTEWSDLVHVLAAVLEPWHDRPSVFFGHSLGALVAYELLAERAARPHPPTLLAVSAMNAPSHLTRAPFAGEAPPSDAALVARIRETEGAPREVLEAPGFVEHYLPILRADLELLARYPSTRLPRTIPGPIVAYRPTEDPWITSLGVARWSDFTRAASLVQHRAGTHFYLFDQLPALIAHICAQAESL